MPWQPNHPALKLIHEWLAAAPTDSNPDALDPQKVIEACADSPFFRQARAGQHDGRPMIYFKPEPPAAFNRPPLREERGLYPVHVAIGRLIELTGGGLELHLPKGVRLQLEKDPTTPHDKLRYQVRTIMPGIGGTEGFITQFPRLLFDGDASRTVREVKDGGDYHLIIPANYELHV